MYGSSQEIVFAILNNPHSPDRVASLEDEHGAGGVIVPVQTLLPLSHPGGGLATLASNLTINVTDDHAHPFLLSCDKSCL